MMDEEDVPYLEGGMEEWNGNLGVSTFNAWV